MNKTKISILLSILFFSFVTSISSVEARSGCCSHHGGVCGCGCCDGTSLSATCAPYYPSCNSRPEPVEVPAPTPVSVPVEPIKIPAPVKSASDSPVNNTEVESNNDAGSVAGANTVGNSEDSAESNADKNNAVPVVAAAPNDNGSSNDPTSDSSGAIGLIAIAGAGGYLYHKRKK